MSGVNKVILVGYVGQKPELRYTSSGIPVANMRLATTERWGKDEAGNTKEHTEWHNVVAWRKLAESCGDYLTRGSPVFVEGRLEQDTWETSDGQKRSRIRVVAYSVQFIRREVQRSASGRQFQVTEAGGETITDSTLSGRIAPAPEDIGSVLNHGDLEELQ